MFAAFALSLGASVGPILEMTPVIDLVVASAFGESYDEYLLLR